MPVISGIPYFAGRRGMIGLYEEKDQRCFEINFYNIERCNMRLGSQWFRLTRIWREDMQ